MFFHLLFFASSYSNVPIADLLNDHAKIQFNSSGLYRITDLETGFIYGRGYISYGSGKMFNASLVNSTKEYVEFNAYCNDDFIHYKVMSKGCYFQWEILDSSKITSEALYFPLIITQYKNAKASYLSGIVMNENYSLNLRIHRNDLEYGSNTYSSLVKYKPINGDFGGDTVSFLTVSPNSIFRQNLQKMLIAENFPTSPHGGPFALDSPKATESYVFAKVTEENVDKWIEMCLKYGIGIIHFDPAYQSLGHYEPNKRYFPNGREGLKRCLDKIHAAGLMAGVHTLSGAIDLNDAYVTNGKPDHRMAVDYRYKLKQAITENDTVIYTTTPPESNLDTVFTYSGKGNILRIGDELIEYKSLRLTEPYGFGDCIRGRFNSKASIHHENDDVNHLHTRYSTFQPEYGSTLVNDIANNIAKLYDLGFDNIYFDGAEGMPNGTIGINQIKKAIFKALKNPGSIESSSWDAASWTFQSRLGAYDSPKWGVKRFVDHHIEENLRQRVSLLPTQMGWWGLINGNTDMYSQLYDEFEYMCCKSISNDMLVSFQRLDPTRRFNSKEVDMMTTFKKWETLRRNKILTHEEKEILKKPRDEFHIDGSIDDGNWNIRKAQYPSQITKGGDNSATKIKFDNPYQSQQLRFRIQNLFSIEPYNSQNGTEIAHFTSESEFSVEKHENTTVDITIDNKIVKESSTSMKIHVSHSGLEKDAPYIKLTKKFSHLYNLQDTGYGFWIYGDGKGEVLNFQLNANPTYASSYDEHYVVVDFVGWKYIEMPLLERDADKFDDYKWPYESSTYLLYIRSSGYKHMEKLNIYMTNIPINSECTVYISPVRMLPLVKTTLKSLNLRIKDQEIRFDNLSIPSGEYFEYTNKSYCHFYYNYDKRQTGDLTFDLNVEDLKLDNGINQFELKYSMDTVQHNVKSRMKITLFEYGDIVVKRGVQDENQTNSTGGLNSGQTAGIIIGVLILIALCVVGGIIAYKKFKGKEESTELFDGINLV